VEPPRPIAEILLDEEIKTEPFDDTIIVEPVLTEMMIAASISVDSNQSSQLFNMINMATEATSAVSTSKTPKAAKRSRMELPLFAEEAINIESEGTKRKNLVKKNIKLREVIEENEAIMEQMRKDYKKISNDFINYKIVLSGLDDC
jgi:hypothetical protein